jgi:hypothetical protein
MQLFPTHPGTLARSASGLIQCGVMLTAAALLAGCGAPGPAADEPPLIDIDGVSHGTLAHPARGRWSTLFFVATDCPISNHYAPELRRICAAYQAAGVQCTLVYSTPQLKADEVRAHVADYSLGLPAVIDRDRVLVARAGATVTPQAAVFTPDGALAYSGRIDDLYAELGRPRQSATERDLRNALDDLVAGRPVRKPRTYPLGCYIE